ncbi:MAG: PTS transporter subunit IIC [Pelolinea sp.]|nr:PTS transporter subunit IIC [Pelolinea sp.]
MATILDNLLQGMSMVVATFGSMIVIPIILFFISLAFGIKANKALQTALFAGIGLTGYSFLIGAYLPIVAPVIENMVKEAGVNLPIMDMGWQVTAIVAYSTRAGMIYLALGLVFQLVLFLTGWTNVFQPSGLWDLYSYALWGSLVFIITNNMLLSVAFMLVLNLWATTFYEMLAKRWSKYYKYPNCMIVQLHNVDPVPFAIFSNWLLNKFGAYKVRWKPDDLRDRLGFMGDPIALGFILGFVLGFLGNINRLGTLAAWGQIMLVAMGTAAVMAIFPRVAAIFAQAFTHLSAASRKFAVDKGREEIYIGVDDASGYGEAATLITGIVLIPVVLLIAAILPGNRVLPLVDLVAIPFIIQSFIAFSNGNIFKSILSAAIWFVGGLLIATATSPIFSDVYNSIATNATAGSLVTSFAIMNKPIWGGFTLFVMNSGWLAVGVLFVVYLVMTLWYKKNKVKVTDWLEKQAELDVVEE